MTDAQKVAFIAQLQAELNSNGKRPLIDLPAEVPGQNKKPKIRVIKVITKPEGEAGEIAQGGYNLQAAMKLDVGEDRIQKYNSILNDVRLNCNKYRIDFRKGSYKKQDPINLAKVFKATLNAHPYLTPERFPANWPTAAIVKQYINGQRKAEARKRAAAAKAAAEAAAAEAAAMLSDEEPLLLEPAPAVAGPSNWEAAGGQAYDDDFFNEPDMEEETDDDLY